MIVDVLESQANKHTIEFEGNRLEFKIFYLIKPDQKKKKVNLITVCTIIISYG